MRMFSTSVTCALSCPFQRLFLGSWFLYVGDFELAYQWDLHMSVVHGSFCVQLGYIVLWGTQVRWRRPRKAGQSIYVDVAVMPGQHMTSSLWGVTITLKGLEHLAEKQGIPQGKAIPKAEWSSQVWDLKTPYFQGNLGTWMGFIGAIVQLAWPPTKPKFCSNLWFKSLCPVHDAVFLNKPPLVTTPGDKISDLQIYIAWQASAFQWRIPVIYPEDGVRHFRLVVTDAFDGKPKDGAFNLSADVSFVIPHTSLSGTSIHGWVEKKGSADDFNEDFGESEGPMVYRSVFCDKMCITGAYVANINYQWRCSGVIHFHQ